MNKDILTEYGKLLYNLLKSSKLTSYFLANIHNEDEVSRIIKYIKKHPRATATDIDEQLIYLRK